MDVLLSHARAFQAHLAWLNLPRLHLVRAREAAPRLAHITLPPGPVFIGFPADRASSLICDGVPVTFGCFVLHGHAQRFFQRTATPARWGSISLSPADLSDLAHALLGRPLNHAPGPIIFQPPRASSLALLRLHAEAGRIAQSDLNRATHPEVLRALEQELVLALVRCLEEGKAESHSLAWQRHAPILARLEAAVNANPDRLLQMSEFSNLAGMSEIPLMALCKQAFGMSPAEYQRRRHLQRAHAELSQGSQPNSNVAEIAQRHGFQGIEQFIKEYLETYGELPA